jgi:hypothetical protein
VVTGRPPLGPPTAGPALNRRRRILARVAGVTGLLIIIVSAIGFAAAPAGGSTIGRGDSYVWRTGSALFLANSADHEDASCAIAGPVTSRFVTIDRRPNSVFENFETNGAWVHRTEPGPTRITCDHDVAISSGPIIALYPVAATPIPFLIGLILVGIWFVRRGGSGSRIFFGPAKRPFLPPN